MVLQKHVEGAFVCKDALNKALTKAEERRTGEEDWRKARGEAGALCNTLSKEQEKLQTGTMKSFLLFSSWRSVLGKERKNCCLYW